ncbi:hypothetical protein GCA01S_039_00050 [Parageobacillus caldoxylosilyticus NBRC 107762]|uniref:Uncharacterized protein n=1 Tax=Parageobacillus caldoxylosilyticus NBRC 107762 TaxID=1220594 RepID=A0A023DGF9_9BACL|nr:hypothetical protein GCA01S_039_00050 [Parageobacillus caldoxylosilyticus NBRC 107762]
MIIVKQNDILFYLVGGAIFGFLFGTIPDEAVFIISTLLGGILAVLVGIFRELLNISKQLEEKKGMTHQGQNSVEPIQDPEKIREMKEYFYISKRQRTIC